MNTTMQSVRVGLFFILGVALIWVIFEALGNKSLFKEPGYTLTSSFNDVKDLKAGDEVRMAGVKIGTVSGTRLKGRSAEVILEVAPNVKVASDSVASIAMAGLLGSHYLSLTLGSEEADFLSDGGQLKSKKTSDLNDVLAQIGTIGDKIETMMGNLSSSLGGISGGGEGGGIFAKLDKLVDENSSNLSQTIENLRTITDKIATGEGTIGKLVNDEGAYNDLIAAVQEIKTAAENASKLTNEASDIFAQVKSGNGALGTLIYNDDIAEQIKFTMTNLSELSEKLNSNEGTLGKLISDDSLYLEAKSAIAKANRTLDGLGDSGAISAVGVAAQALF
jgi:phospholipid/cholesterol/gamma-HCH transport system substrate-binding protein